MAVGPREEVDAGAEAVALHHGQAPLGLRGGQGGPEGRGGQLGLVAQVSFHEVDAASETGELEAALLLVVPGVASREPDAAACVCYGKGWERV